MQGIDDALDGSIPERLWEILGILGILATRENIHWGADDTDTTTRAMDRYYLGERLMWWHGGAGLTERSERGSLSAVATHDVFGLRGLDEIGPSKRSEKAYNTSSINRANNNVWDSTHGFLSQY